MTDKELRRLKRVDLLELLIAQTRENDRLRKDLAQARARLAERDLVLDQAGSIAEAALRINKVFEATQDAVDQYMDSLQRLGDQRWASWDQMEKEAQARADGYIQAAMEKCREMEAEAIRRRDAILAQPPGTAMPPASYAQPEKEKPEAPKKKSASGKGKKSQ